MNAIFYLIYLAMGVVQLIATYSFFHDYWHWSFITSGIASFIVAYIPVVGSICGVIGAMKAWGWEWWQAGLLFFWWVPLAIIYIVLSPKKTRDEVIW